MSDIDISVTPISGRLRFVVAVDRVPSVNNYTWKSFDKHLVIKTNHELFSNDGTYYVLVYNDELNTLNSS